MNSSLMRLSRASSSLVMHRGLAFRGRGLQPTTPVTSKRCYTPMPERVVTLVPGDGIGPECCAAVTGVLAAAGCPIRWERFDHFGEDPLQVQEVITSISANGIAFKGPLYTRAERWSPKSRNMQIRKALDLFANVVPIRQSPGVETRHSGTKVDLVIIRENTEGEYTGIEHEVAPGVVQSTKVITAAASERIARFAFEYAASNGRSKVSAIHKANIQSMSDVEYEEMISEKCIGISNRHTRKLSDGQFLLGCQTVAKEYPDIEYEEMIVDNCSMQLAMRPEQFDVMVTPNLYGTIVTNIASGLVGGPGMLPGANFGGRGQAIFESGARHVALGLKGSNRANPVGTLRAAVMMLQALDMHEQASLINQSIELTLSEKKVRTRDLGGVSSTHEFTAEVIRNLGRAIHSDSDSDSD